MLPLFTFLSLLLMQPGKFGVAPCSSLAQNAIPASTALPISQVIGVMNYETN
ncbi:MAG: hypothetical protein ACRCWD_03785 [Culicoidibacterales bacterium]